MAKGTLRVNGVLVASEIHKIVQESGTGSGGGTGVGDEILLETGFHILTEVSATAAIQAQTGDNIVIREDDGSAVLTVDTSGVATFTGNVNVGTDDVGHDVKFHGATAGSYMLWDESIDDLIVGGAGRVGIGTTTPQYGLEVATATGGDISFLRDDTSIAANDTIGTLHFSGNDPSHRVGAQIKVNAHDAWATNDCPTYMTFHTTDDATASIDERMRITHNGNIGIGTTAPTNLLHLAESDTSSVYLQFSNSTTGHAGTDGFFIGVNGGGTAAVNLWNLENTAMRFATNDTQRMTILGNGKVGIGTDTPNTHLEVSDTVPTFRLNSTETNVGNTDILGEISWKSADGGRAGDPAAALRAISSIADGSHTDMIFLTGEDGSAASEKMRINSAGLVGIGTTVPGAKLHVLGNNDSTSDPTSGAVIVIGNSDDTNDNYASLLFKDAQGNDAALVGAKYTNHSTNQGDLVFWTRPGSGSMTQRMVIKGSDGNVGIGNSTPAVRLDTICSTNEVVAAFSRSNDASTYVTIRTAETQNHTGAWYHTIGGAAVTGVGSTNSVTGILSTVTNSGGTLTGDLSILINSGDSLITRSCWKHHGELQHAGTLRVKKGGVTAGSGTNHSSNGWWITTDGTGSSSSGSYSWFDSYSYGPTDTVYGGFRWYSTYGGGTGDAERMSIQTDGEIHGNFSDTSDKTLKENFEKVELGISAIKKLNPVLFDWKDSKKRNAGFVAQEVEKVVPYIVSGKEGKKTIKVGGILSYAVKAIQELSEKVEAQEKELQALRA